MSGTGSTVTVGAFPDALGVTCVEGGAHAAVFSDHADSIELCLFADDSMTETDRIRLSERDGPIHHAFVPGLAPGGLYGLRAHGPYAPEAGHLFNPAKLLLDPYATRLSEPVTWAPELSGADRERPSKPDPKDSAPFMAKCVAAEALAKIDPAEKPATPWEETIIYEAHVKGLTHLWPGLDTRRIGYTEALGAPVVIDYLKGLGVTAIELLPIHAYTDERQLVERQLVNYWGYNSVGFFAADPRYLGPAGLAGLRETVRRLHAAGIEVILDVVYNHTGESDGSGPTLCFRGLDNLSYYVRDEDASDGYANHTGCGNTLDLSHPYVLRLVMDSMRWWTERIGIDGFRFDLAPTLVRGPGGFDPDSAFLNTLLQDPVLQNAKLIAEPWDIGPEGYRLGAFPHPFAEWNDRFRDQVRGFWRGEAGSTQRLADGLLGSARVFDHGGRRPWASINFVACHDGFTMADLTRYEEKHNEANGEDNRDGHNENLSDNFGVEGPSEAPDIVAARKRRERNLIATVMLAQGTPMLRAGDEIGQSQDGNNNAYCQDGPITWIDWDKGDHELLAFVRYLTGLRRSFPALRQSRFLHGENRGADGLADVEWLGLSGGSVDWDDPGLPGYAALLRATDTERGRPEDVLLILNRGDADAEFKLPGTEGRHWAKLLDTADPAAAEAVVSGAIAVPAESVLLLAGRLPDSGGANE